MSTCRVYLRDGALPTIFKAFPSYLQSVRNVPDDNFILPSTKKRKPPAVRITSSNEAIGDNQEVISNLKSSDQFATSSSDCIQDMDRQISKHYYKWKTEILTNL